jgi:ATP-GRASP peptide maturase of grasp-with-spasm system
MKLIFSQNFDPSTDYVIEWLNKLDKPFYRINYNTDFVSSVYLEMTDSTDTVTANFNNNYDINDYVKHFTIQLSNGVTIDLKKVTGVWYRRGGMPDFDTSFIKFSVLKTKLFIKNARSYVMSEYDEIVRFIYHFLFSNPLITTLGNPGLTSSNKVTYLAIAKMHGLRIPDFYIVSNKKDLISVIDKVTHKITKGISEMVMFAQDYLKLISYTSNIDHSDVNGIQDFFFPSAIQKKVLKLADIRIVYLNGEIFSMAIFSQNNKKTNTDFRNYDTDNPNRNTPFQLPVDIEQKIRSLCSYLRINFCSMDILLDEQYEYYFLEINPVGQFGMTSLPCNYYIEKKIAEFL